MDPFRRAMFFGLGVMNLTRKEAEEIIDSLVRRGEVSADERTDVVERLLEEAQMQKDSLEEKAAVTVQNTLKTMGVPTTKDIRRIQRRLTSIEKAMGGKKKAH